MWRSLTPMISAALGNRKPVFQNAVEHLDPGLFLLIQLYIPHRDDIFAEQLAGDRIVEHQHDVQGLLHPPWRATPGRPGQ